MTPTPKSLEAMYLMLCQLKPFNRWDLPSTAEIKFLVTDEEDAYGTYEFDEEHIITISKAKCSHFETIIKTLAHEVIHMKRMKFEDWDKHNAAFKRYSKQISAEFGFDPLEL